MIRISCEETFNAIAAAEYEQWLDEREAQEQSWERAMAYADTDEAYIMQLARFLLSQDG